MCVRAHLNFFVSEKLSALRWEFTCSTRAYEYFNLPAWRCECALVYFSAALTWLVCASLRLSAAQWHWDSANQAVNAPHLIPSRHLSIGLLALPLKVMREREIIAVIWDIWTASSILKDESYMKLTSICLRSYFGKIIWRTSRCVFRGFPKHIQIYQYISINYLDCHGLPCSIMGDMVNITPTKLRHVSIVLVSMLTWASPVKHSCVWTQPRWAAGVAADSRAVGIKMYSINPCRYIKGILWY